jgi:hypothetical protein
MNNAKDYVYVTSKSQIKQDTDPIPTMGVNELKAYFGKINMIEHFKTIFNKFLNEERS